MLDVDDEVLDRVREPHLKRLRDRKAGAPAFESRRTS